ncbi:MAG: ACP S-malonyltransferase [Pseudomonadota bacterium]
MTIAALFPGQGAQSVGMLGEFADRVPAIKQRFKEASDAISAPLFDYVFEGPEETLNLTEFTQPAILTASVALWEHYCSEGGPAPSVLAGHSLGEYSALVCGGALSFDAGVRLVHLRGKFMQEAVPVGEGAIAAVLGLDDERVESACAEAATDETVVSPANYNAPGQVAIAGAKPAVARAIELCKAAGAKKAVMLNLSVPVHCALMAPAGAQLKAAIDAVELRMPNIPIVHNVDAERAEDLGGLKRRLLAQLAEPVQWTRSVQAIAAAGVTAAIECGPGKVLGGLVKRIERGLKVHATDRPDTMVATIDALSS